MQRAKLTVTISLFLVLIALLSAVACSKSSPAPTQPPAQTKPSTTAAPATTAAVTQAPAQSKPAATTQAPASSKPATTPAAAGPSFKLKIVSNMPKDSYVQVTQREWMSNIEQKTKGRITFDAFLSGELYTSTDTPRVLPAGLVDVVNESANGIAAVSSPMGIILLPGVWDSFEHQSKGVHAMWDILDAEAQTKNIKLLGFIFSGVMPGPLSIAPIHTVADFKAKKIRTPGGETSQLISEWGAAPSNIATPEVYVAIQKGTIDGAMTVYSSLYDRSWYEVAKNLLDMTVYISLWPFMVNLDTWKKLPPDMQQIMLDATKDIEPIGMQRSIDDDKKAKQRLADKGVVIYTPTAQENAGYEAGKKKVRDTWAAKNSKHPQLLDIADKSRK